METINEADSDNGCEVPDETVDMMLCMPELVVVVLWVFPAPRNVDVKVW